MRRNLALWLVLGFAATGLLAETAAPSWGLSSESLLSIPAVAFDTLTSEATWEPSGQGSRYVVSGPSGFVAAVVLPSGALVTGLELQGCDESPTARLLVSLFQLTTAGGLDVATAVGLTLDTGGATIPNCGQFSLPFATPVPIQNADSVYVVLVQQAGPGNLGGAVRFAGVRIRYRLQVSPAPAVATFADVPTGHQQFRFIEALFASGITAGCGSGNYCPDAPVTRGQMAVFLSAALGLHFPN